MGPQRQAGLTPAGIHIVKVARPGKPTRWYIYAWRGGPAIRVHPGTDRPRLTREDIAAIAAAHAADRAPADTVAGLTSMWTQSREWQALAISTADLWSGALLRIEAKWGKVPLRVFADPRMTPKILKWRDDMGNTPRAADEHVKVLRMLLAWGMLHGRVICNPAAAIPTLYRGGQREEIVWLPEDCAAFDREADPNKRGPQQWLVDARRLAELTGLRRADLVAVTFADVSETHIALTAGKKSNGKRRRVVVPIVPGLRELVAELRTRHRNEGVTTLIVGSRGNPVTPGTLTVEFNRRRNAANAGRGIVYPAQHADEHPRAKHLHDLRGTFATRLMTLPGGSLTDAQIALILGWTEHRIAAIRRRYVDETAIVVAIATRMAATQV